MKLDIDKYLHPSFMSIYPFAHPCHNPKCCFSQSLLVKKCLRCDNNLNVVTSAEHRLDDVIQRVSFIYTIKIACNGLPNEQVTPTPRRSNLTIKWRSEYQCAHLYISNFGMNIYIDPNIWNMWPYNGVNCSWSVDRSNAVIASQWNKAISKQYENELGDQCNTALSQVRKQWRYCSPSLNLKTLSKNKHYKTKWN